MKIAVVGAGISGLSVASMLQKRGHEITLFESAHYLGGHTHTVDIDVKGSLVPVDTGFLVYNDRTYPNLVALFDQLGVITTASEMSFSVRVDDIDLEWAGTDLSSVFAQKRNLVSPRVWAMLRSILRFNRITQQLLRDNRVADESLGEFLVAEGFGPDFRDWYLIPMAAAIWSSPRDKILEFPLETFLRFCHNHGLLQIFNRPKWRTVKGGGREYVRRLASSIDDIRIATPVQRIQRKSVGVDVDSLGRPKEHFDQLILACHSDQALSLLSDLDECERRCLSAVRYQSNRVVLHSDIRLLPRRRAAWAAWNYLSTTTSSGNRPVAVSYLINKLQPLGCATPIIVTLNPPYEPASISVWREFEYSHPLFDRHTLEAQSTIKKMQGRRSTWYCGAWLGYGFHEDGLKSAMAVADKLASLESFPAAAPALAAA